MLRWMALLTIALFVGGCASVIEGHQWSSMDEAEVVRVVAVIRGNGPPGALAARADSIAAGVSAYLATEGGFEVRTPEWTRSFCDSISTVLYGLTSDAEGAARGAKRCAEGEPRMRIPDCFCSSHIDALRGAGVDVVLAAGVSTGCSRRHDRSRVLGYSTADGSRVMYAGTSEYRNWTRYGVRRQRPLRKHIDTLVRLTAEILEHPGRRYELDEEQPWTDPARLLLEE